MLIKFNKINLNPVNTPSEPGLKLNKNEGQATLEEINLYQQYISKLIFLSTRTRLDITFSVNNCARYMTNLSQQHFNAVNRIFKYLIGTQDLGLISYSKSYQNSN